MEETLLEPTIKDVLTSVQDQKSDTDQRFDELLDAIQDFSGRVDDRFDRLETRMDRMNCRMDRQEGKLNVLVNVLHEKNVITEDDKRNVHT